MAANRLGCLLVLSSSHRFLLPAFLFPGLAPLASKRLDIESLSFGTDRLRMVECRILYQRMTIVVKEFAFLYPQPFPNLLDMLLVMLIGIGSNIRYQRMPICPREALRIRDIVF